jgi:hypothetical protein
MKKLTLACWTAGALAALPVLVATTASVALAASAAPAPKRTDASLTASLVGTWINPPDSADYEGVPSRELYNADGTYTYTEYEDKACKNVASALTSKWYVWDGTLIVDYGDGKTLKDEIVTLAPKKVVLRALDDGLTYHRVKSAACPTTLAMPKKTISANTNAH